MKPWDEEFGGTWLADTALVGELDAWVRGRLVAHRAAHSPNPESVAPWGIELLASEIRRLGDQGRWLWCTSAISLLAELLFCADAGGPFPSHCTGFRYDLDLTVKALRVVRNSAFHPAFQNEEAGSGKPHIARKVSRSPVLTREPTPW